MKVLNIVMSILILILAIASAVFSYMLFEKREQMLNGYETMGNQIVSAAKALDNNSGTSVSSELGGDALDHKNESLDSALRKLTNLAKSVSQERDTLAQTLSNIDKIAGGNTSTADLSQLSTADSSAAAVEAQVNALNRNREAIVSAMMQSANDFGISLNKNNLRGSDAVLNGELNSYTAELLNLKKYKEAQEATMKQIATTLGVTDLRFTPVRYTNDLKKYSDAIEGLRNDKNSLEKAKSDLTSKLATADKNITDMNAEIAAMKQEIADRERDLKVLTASIKGERYMDEIVLWQPGSVEARKAAQGKVIDVNKLYGFITIDIGSDYNVDQLISSESAPIAVNPLIAVDDVMLVSPALSKDAKSAGKLKIFKVEGSCAFANVAETTSREIKVGDVVIFDIEAN